MARLLQFWHEDISKRKVKAPKLFFCDSDLLRTPLRIGDQDALLHHPKLGASWEGFAIEETIRALDIGPREVWFLGHPRGRGAGLSTGPRGFEDGLQDQVHRRAAHHPSMRAAIDTLGLYRLIVAYPGERRLPLAENVEAIGLTEVVQTGLEQ